MGRAGAGRNPAPAGSGAIGAAFPVTGPRRGGALRAAGRRPAPPTPDPAGGREGKAPDHRRSPGAPPAPPSAGGVASLPAPPGIGRAGARAASGATGAAGTGSPRASWR